ncbi:MAG TPA: hypothetical protein VGT41_06740 [Candidatus Babeliales bacterium]|nr:hypothetical protein [Candidatus Babeliales bacterium]
MIVIKRIQMLLAVIALMPFSVYAADAEECSSLIRELYALALKKQKEESGFNLDLELAKLQQAEEEYRRQQEEKPFTLNPELSSLQRRRKSEVDELDEAAEEEFKRQCVLYAVQQDAAAKQPEQKCSIIQRIVDARNGQRVWFGNPPAESLLLSSLKNNFAKSVTEYKSTDSKPKRKRSALVRRTILPTQERLAVVLQMQQKQVRDLHGKGVKMERDNFDAIVYDLPKVTRVQ